MKWIPFFKTGLQKDSLGREKLWTAEDLDFAVNNYNALKPEQKRPIVVGHPGDNLPAMGFMDKVKRIGNTLYALPGNVSKTFLALLKQGKFPSRSISFNADGTINHFGFLPIGIEPAVKDLGNFNFSADTTNTINYSFNELEDDEENDLNADLLRIEAELEIINKQIEKLLGNKIDEDNLEEFKKIESLNAEAEKASFMQKLDKYVETGKITPALKNKYAEVIEILDSTKLEYSSSSNTIYQKLSEIIELSEIVLNFNEEVVKKQEYTDLDEFTQILNSYKI